MGTPQLAGAKLAWRHAVHRITFAGVWPLVGLMIHGHQHKSGVVLRPAVAGDAAGIVAIERLSFDHAGERFGDRRIRYLIGNDRCVVTVAQVEDIIAGWAAGHTARRDGGPWGRIYALAIHPDARGRKLGPKLLGQMIDALRQRGSDRLYLEVRPDNHAAIKLYEKFGFSFCAHLAHYYGPDRHAQRMVLTLLPSSGSGH